MLRRSGIRSRSRPRSRAGRRTSGACRRRFDHVPRPAGTHGLLYPRCVLHRGTTTRTTARSSRRDSLLLSRRLFACRAACLDMPCEPPDKNASDRYRATFRQPWYPVQEYHGLLFAYLGPPTGSRRCRATTCWSSCRPARRSSPPARKSASPATRRRATGSRRTRTYGPVSRLRPALVAHSGNQFVPIRVCCRTCRGGSRPSA